MLNIFSFIRIFFCILLLFVNPSQIGKYETHYLPLNCDIFGKIGRFYVKKGRYAKASERADFDRHFILTELHFGLSFNNYDELDHWLTAR